MNCNYLQSIKEKEIFKILTEMNEICNVWVKMNGKVKSYTQDDIWLIYEYIKELRKENKLLKSKIPYIIQNNLCKCISIEKCKNKVCVDYEIQENEGGKVYRQNTCEIGRRIINEEN